MFRSPCVWAMLLLFGASSHGQVPIVELGGGEAWQYGRDFDVVGDVDGDGWLDLAIANNNQPAQWIDLRSSATGATLHKFAPAKLRLINQVHAAGDLDGDGIGDYRTPAVSDASDYNHVLQVSGKTGQVLMDFRDTTPGSSDTSQPILVSMADVDGDAVSDFLLRERLTNSTSAIWAYSGANGALLYQQVGVAHFGDWLDEVGDVDLDGMADFVAGNFEDVSLHRGSDGFVLRKHSGLYTAVSAAGDVDKDGAADYLLARDLLDPPVVELRSGLTGSLLRTFVSPYAVDASPSIRLAPVGDVDGDGSDEIAIGWDSFTSSAYTQGNFIHVHSAVSGQIRWVLTEKPTDLLEVLRGSYDVDGDGLHDVLLSRVGASVGGDDGGGVFVYAAGGRPSAAALGKTCAGWIYNPKLALDLVPGAQQPQLTLTNAPPGAPASLLLATEPGLTKFGTQKVCNLYLPPWQAPWIGVQLVVPPSGTAVITGPAAVPFIFVAQVMTTDPLDPQAHVLATNGVMYSP